MFILGSNSAGLMNKKKVSKETFPYLNQQPTSFKKARSQKRIRL